jgi:inorganic pyrophosphatase
VIIEAVIEDPKGATCRHHLDRKTGEWREVAYPFEVDPWPANYGFLPGTYNIADDDELDVIVLAREPLATGTQLPVRPVGLLRLADQDHKILAVAVDDPLYGEIRALSDIPPDDLMAIEQWFPELSRVNGWEDVSHAEELITIARAERADDALEQQRKNRSR